MKPRHPSNDSGLEQENRRQGYSFRDRRKRRQEEDGVQSRSSAVDHSAGGPSDDPKPGWKDLLRRTKGQMAKDNLSIVAAGVAFYVFLGLIPALGAVVSIWGLVSDPATIQEQIDSMSGMLPQDVIKIVDEQMSAVSNQKAGATLGAIVGVLLAIWSGAKAMKSLMNGLNVTYGEEETRGFIRLNVTAIALTVAGIVGFLLAVGIIVALPIGLQYVGLGSTAAALVNIVRWPLLGIFAALGLGILYRFGPDRNPARRRWVSWGAVLATLMWIAGSAGFSFYVSNFGNYNKTYGSLGAVVVFLMWFLLSAYVVLFGAELNAEMDQTARDTIREPDEPRGKRGAHGADEIGAQRRN